MLQDWQKTEKINYSTTTEHLSINNIAKKKDITEELNRMVNVLLTESVLEYAFIPGTDTVIAKREVRRDYNIEQSAVANRSENNTYTEQRRDTISQSEVCQMDSKEVKRLSLSDMLLAFCCLGIVIMALFLLLTNILCKNNSDENENI